MRPSRAVWVFSVVAAWSLLVTTGWSGSAAGSRAGSAEARSAATSAPAWSRWFPFQAVALAIARNGTVVVVGNDRPGYPGGHILLRGVRPDGSRAWGASWKPEGGGARARGIDLTTAGVYVSGTVAADQGSGGCEEIGSVGWFVRGSGPFGRDAWVRALPGWRRCTTTAGGPVGAGGGVIAIGWTGLIEGYTDVHGAIIGFDPQGEQRWTNPFEPFPVGGPSGYDADDVEGLAVDALGRTYAAGWAWRYPRESGADHEAALVALDRRGHDRWVRVFGEPGRPRDDLDMGTDVAVRGSLVSFGARMDRREGPSIARVVMLDTAGRIAWSAGFPTRRAYAPMVHVAIGRGGVAYLATLRPRTESGRDLIVRKLNPGGRVIWQHALSASEGLVDLAAGDTGVYVLTRRHLRWLPV